LTDHKEINIVKTLVASAKEMESDAHEELHHLHDQPLKQTTSIRMQLQKEGGIETLGALRSLLW